MPRTNESEANYLCENCGERFEAHETGGGRCLNCGSRLTLIRGTNSQETRRLESTRNLEMLLNTSRRIQNPDVVSSSGGQRVQFRQIPPHMNSPISSVSYSFNIHDQQNETAEISREVLPDDDDAPLEQINEADSDAQIERCSICGNRLNSNWSRQIWREYKICSSCRDRSNPVFNYSYKPTTIFHGRGKKKFGVEVEMVTRRQADTRGTEHLIHHRMHKAVRDLFYMKYDTSIENGHGLELITHPMSLKFMLDNKPFDFLKEMPVRSFRNTTTGIHVHVSREALSELTIAKILYFFAHPHNEEFIQKLSQRTPTSYCRKNADRFYEGKNVNKDEQAGRTTRYLQINLQNRQTIEFRHFKGNVNPKAIYRAVQFVDAITRFCANTKTGDLTWEHFMEYICDYRANKFGYRHGWKLLRKFLKRGRAMDHWKNIEVIESRDT